MSVAPRRLWRREAGNRFAAQGGALPGRHRHDPVRRPADRDRRARAARQGRREGQRPAGCHRHRQDRDGGVAHRAVAAAGSGDAAQQDARRPVRQRAARDAPQQRRRVLRLLLRLLPARGVRPADRHLHREGLLDQRRGRPPAPLGDQLPADAPRHRRGGLGLLHLRPRHPAGVRRPHGPAQGRAGDRARPAPAPPRRHAVRPQRPVLHPGHLPGPRRHHRGHPAVRRAGRAHRDVRRRDREALDAPPAHRRGDHRGSRALHLPRLPLRRGPRAHGAGDPRHRGRARRLARHHGEAGQAAGGPAAAHAHHLRHRDDAPGRHLLRHRELLAAHRRPRGRHRAQHPARLLPRGLLAGPRRVAPERPADRRDVRGRRLPQAHFGRPRLPAAVRDGQPAAQVGGVPRAHRPDRLPLGHPGPVRAGPQQGRGGRAGHPPDRPGRPRGDRQADQGADRRPGPRDPRAHREERAGPRHHADQEDVRGPHRLPPGARHPRALPPQRGRHAAPHRVAPRAAHGRVRRAGRHQPPP